MKINLQKFEELVGQGYLSCQKHPTEDLYIWNYTQRCQFERKWSEETRMARGLITNKEGEILYRPFSKFFNYGEEGVQLPVETFTVQEKFDGSLGILYWIGEEPYIATRGSFTSDQAIKGTQILRDMKIDLSDLNRKYTYLFEIIYPENRIVVDYGSMESLVLLAIINTETGKDFNIHNCSVFQFAGMVDEVTDFDELKSKNLPNKEGYVIKFDSGVRVKVKFEEYVRLHRLVTGVNAKTIWDFLRHNQPFDELLTRVPDEFFEWVKNTKQKLVDEFNIAEAVSLRDYEAVKDLPTRREQALKIFEIDSQREKKLSGVIFSLLNKKPYEDIIWRMIKPRADKPWKEDDNA